MFQRHSLVDKEFSCPGVTGSPLADIPTPGCAVFKLLYLGVDAVDVARAEPGELAEDVVGEDVHPEEARQHRELHQETADLARHVEVIFALVTEIGSWLSH